MEAFYHMSHDFIYKKITFHVLDTLYDANSRLEHHIAVTFAKNKLFQALISLYTIQICCCTDILYCILLENYKHHNVLLPKMLFRQKRQIYFTETCFKNVIFYDNFQYSLCSPCSFAFNVLNYHTILIACLIQSSFS